MSMLAAPDLTSGVLNPLSTSVSEPAPSGDAWSAGRPSLDAVPDAAWGDHTTWWLSLPDDATVLGSAVYGRHLLATWEEILARGTTNLAAAPMRAVADAALAARLPHPAGLHAAYRAPIQRARARFLQRIHGAATSAPAPRTPRTAEPQRLGVVLQGAAGPTVAHSLLARLGHLEPGEFELRLYSVASGYSPSSMNLENRLGPATPLPESLAAQINFLRTEELDALIFADDLASHPFPYAHLALHRLAPVQLAAHASTTTGLPEIDYWLAGENDAAASVPRQFTERLALLPGTARVFDLGLAATAPAAHLDRPHCGIPVDAVVFAALVQETPSFAGLAEALATTLQAHPTAHLLLADLRSDPFAGNPALSRALEDRGIDWTRIHQVTPDEATPVALRDLLILSNVIATDDALGAALALESQVPIVAPIGSPAADVLRTAGLSSWIAEDDQALALVLHRVSTQTEVARAELAAARPESQLADPFLASEELAALLRAAWAELTPGAKSRRQNSAPLVIPPDLRPDPRKFPAIARELIETGQAERAVPRLLSALQHGEPDASLWYDLALAYREAGAPEQALPALEASLRLDDSCAPAWVMLAELAADVGSTELALDALQLAAERDPSHPALPGLVARLAA